VKSPDGYPELTLLVSNQGSITGFVTGLVYDATKEPSCLNDGVPPPQVTYDVLLPDLQGSDLTVKLLQTYQIDPGAEGSITLKVGRVIGRTDRCDISPTVRLQYVDASGKTRTSQPLDGTAPFLKVRPLKKCPVLLSCVLPSLPVLPSQPPIKL
jgi:hypothetical protein